MKKILCIVLTICILISVSVAPVPSSATDSVTYEETTLGSYYKFTFSEDEIYNYAFGKQATYKNNTFMPLHSQTAEGTKVGYKQVTDSVTGEKYDTLEIKGNSVINFTPLTKSGQPYELTPGNEYRVKIQLFNPVSNAWAHAFVCVGQDSTPIWGKLIEIGENAYNYTTYPYCTTASLSNQGGMAWHYIIKDGTYGKTSTFKNYNGGVCLHTLSSNYGLNCTHSAKTSGSPYIEKERTFSLPVDHFEYDEENMSYSANRPVYTLNGSSYQATGETLQVNNYLTFYLAGGNVSTYAKGNYPLYGNAEYSDLYDESGKAKGNYTSWQIESIEIWETVMGTVKYHMDDTVTTSSGEVGTAVDINPPADYDRHFEGWYLDAEYKTLVTTAPLFAKGTVLNLYGKFSDYPDNVTYDLRGTNPTLKDYTYMKDGVYTTVKLTESGWAHKSFSDDGLELGKNATGNAYRWNPSNTSGLTQVTSLSHYVALTTDAQVGEQVVGGWGAYSNYVIRDKEGNPAVAKENTKYAVILTYEKLSEGSQSIFVAAGRKAAYVTQGANDKGSRAYNCFSSSEHYTTTEKITGEDSTQTFYVNTGTFSEGDVPVFSIHNGATGYIVERVADVNGVKSYEVNGNTYYPYKIISYPRIVVKSVQIVEIDSGNVAVSYNYYEKGKGFTTVLAEGKPGTPLASTQNVDPYWYDSMDARGKKYSVFPYASLNLYNANYYMETDGTAYPDSPIFGDKATVSPVTLNDGGKEIYALKYTSKNKVTLNDAQVLRLGDLRDGHTYKFTASVKADSLKTDLKLVFASADNTNALQEKNLTAEKTVAVGDASNDEWETVTCYFTADPTGVVADKEQHGFDYRFLSSNNSLFLYFVQDEAKENTLYFSDIKVEDLGKIITNAGAAVLTDKAAQSAGHQAIRYYFGYNTVNGRDISFGGETFTVKERGFIYKYGALACGATEPGNFFATNGRIVKSSKSSDFDKCWDYSDGVLTFSTFVKDLDIADDVRKVQVKAYLIVEDADGNSFYVYSDSINRSVDGIKNGDPLGRRLIWSEEFNVDSISEINTFTQKYDTMTSYDSNLVTSTSEENYFIDPTTGELVLRNTSDGNRNYKTPKSVTTRDIMSYRYGYLEMRAKVPCGKGLWPSFWMQPDKSVWNKAQYTGEIDIFEGYGGPYTFSANLHKWYTDSDGKSTSTTIGKNGNYLYGQLKYGKDSAAFAEEYHTYGFEWTPEFMAFYIDDELYCKIDITEETGEYNPNVPGMDCFHKYYYICFNNWMFTDQDTWVNADNRVENLPDMGTVDYKIDYVRLYQSNSEEIYLY